MSRPSLRLVSSSASPLRRTAETQMSRENALCASRAVRTYPVVDQAEFRAWWAGVLRRRCGADAVTISRTFSRTEQTGYNWLNEASTPLAHDLDLAMSLWPEEFIARYAPAFKVAA